MLGYESTDDIHVGSYSTIMARPSSQLDTRKVGNKEQEGWSERDEDVGADASDQESRTRRHHD